LSSWAPNGSRLFWCKKPSTTLESSIFQGPVDVFVLFRASKEQEGARTTYICSLIVVVDNTFIRSEPCLADAFVAWTFHLLIGPSHNNVSSSEWFNACLLSLQLCGRDSLSLSRTLMLLCRCTEFLWSFSGDCVFVWFVSLFRCFISSRWSWLFSSLSRSLWLSYLFLLNTSFRAVRWGFLCRSDSVMSKRFLSEALIFLITLL